MLRKTKNLLYKLRFTAFHPQWFTYKDETANRAYISSVARGKTLDIGCADKSIGKHLTNVSEHIGLDYYQTAKNWYDTRPDIFGNAQALPIADNSMDTVLLLDVLEHLPEPDACIAEIYRVLIPGGTLVLQVPFVYPLHDEPLDFHRWSSHGLERLVSRHGLQVIDSTPNGTLFESAGLLLNIALVKTLLNWIDKKHPGLLLGIFIPPVILTVNLVCWFLHLISPKDFIMPHGYRYTVIK